MNIDGLPVNKLAALGLVGERAPLPDVYQDGNEEWMKRQAKKLRKATGEQHRACLDAVAQRHGFRDWVHFVDFKKRRGEREGNLHQQEWKA